MAKNWCIASFNMGIGGHCEMVIFGRLFRISTSYGSVACLLEHFESSHWSGVCPVSFFLEPVPGFH
jgi:hypothetical protein